MTKGEFELACKFGFGLWSQRADDETADGIKLAWGAEFGHVQASVFRDALLTISRRTDRKSPFVPTVGELRQVIQAATRPAERPLALLEPPLDPDAMQREADGHKRRGWHRSAEVFSEVAESYRRARAEARGGKPRHPGFPLSRLAHAMMQDAADEQSVVA